MSNDLATKSRWRIKCSQGNKRLRRVKDAKVSDGRKSEAQNALGENAPIGTVDSPGPRNITFSVYQEVGDPEIDYDALCTSKEWFTLEQELVGGKEWQFIPCKVVKCDDDSDADGKNMLSVEIIALDKKPL